MGFSAALNSEGLRYWPVDFSSANGILGHRSGSAVTLILDFFVPRKGIDANSVRSAIRHSSINIATGA
jgi:hypothetical protein